jgi:hypothetical protein
LLNKFELNVLFFKLIIDLLAETKTIRKLKPNENLDVLSDNDEEIKQKDNNNNIKKKKNVVIFK